MQKKRRTIRPKINLFKRGWFWFLLLVLISIPTGFYFTLFYPGFQLKNIIISGNDKVKTQDLQSFISNEAVTGLLKLGGFEINSKSVFLINENKIRKDVLGKFPEIESLNINRNLPQTLVTGVVERKPVGVFCSNNNECFLIDDNGIIFEPLFVPISDLVIVRQTASNSQVFTGEEVVAQNIIDMISKVQKSLKDNFQIDLKEALVASPKRLNVKTNQNWQIYFDSGSDINPQLIKLNLVLSEEISPSQRKNLRYIDLRPKDRAIICDNSVCGGQ